VNGTSKRYGQARILTIFQRNGKVVPDIDQKKARCKTAGLFHDAWVSF
jgi:hypothetical protein